MVAAPAACATRACRSPDPFTHGSGCWSPPLHTHPAAAVTIPVIASSGAGAPEHFSEVFNKTKAAAALAAGIFHRREVPIASVKEHLSSSGIPARTA